VLNIMSCENDGADEALLEQVLASCKALGDVDYHVESYRTTRQLLLNFEVATCDVLFLDIMLDEGDQDGIQLAREIRAKSPYLPIVFITSSRDFAIDSYQVSAVHYLVKPITPDKMDEALDRCRQVIESKRRIIQVTSGRMSERVLARKVLYAEAYGHHVTLKTRDGKMDVSTPLSKIAEDGGRSFLRCHRSYVINMDYVKGVQNRCFLMADGTEVPIRTNGSAQVVATYHNYLFDTVRNQ